MRYRIVKETNQLTGRMVYYIEEKTTFLWKTSWTRNLSVEGVTGQVASLTLHGIKHKLNEVRWGGNMVKTEVIETDDNKTQNS
jgi:hypothetical protein